MEIPTEPKADPSTTSLPKKKKPPIGSDEKKDADTGNPNQQRLSANSIGSLKQNSQRPVSQTSIKRQRHRQNRSHHAYIQSEASDNDNDNLYGNWQHAERKDPRYFYEFKAKEYDPFYQVNVGTDCETYFVGQKARTLIRETEHFAYIVDLDNYEYHKVVFHSFLNEILQSPYFRHGILFLVFVNAVLIGVQTLQEVSAYILLMEVLDMIILSVFIFEVIIKWIYDFRLFWDTKWNILDFSIISLTMLAAVVPVRESGDAALITVKVVRAFRSLRCVSSMTSLGIVSHTVIKSGLDMGNILLVLLIIMLVLSVMAVILFDIDDLSPQRFLNALDSWFILFICVTQDGWAQVLNSYRNSGHFEIIAVYLIFSVSLGAFVFANLIVAVIVANLELSVKELRQELKLLDNPLEFDNTEEGVHEVDVLPVYDLLSKNSFVCTSQRPLKIPMIKKMSSRKMQAHTSLVVALEQNMLEAEIICLDLEKIMAVILSIVVQLDVNTGKIAKKERDVALAALGKLLEQKTKRFAQRPRLKSTASKLKTFGKWGFKKPPVEPEHHHDPNVHVHFTGGKDY